jgi:hypothetical protein
MKLLYVLSVCCLGLVCSCTTPNAVRPTYLMGQETKEAIRLSSILPDTVNVEDDQQTYDLILIGATEHLLVATACTEYPDIIAISVFLYNADTLGHVEFDPDSTYLKDGSFLMFRPLLPHEAANLLVSQTSEVPTYVPKYTYRVSTETQADLSLYDYGYGYYSGQYSGTSQSTVHAEEDPWNKLGWAIGAAMVEHSNKQLLSLAAEFYETGLVPVRIPPKTAVSGQLFWLNRAKYFPLILTLTLDGYSLEFNFSDSTGE